MSKTFDKEIVVVSMYIDCAKSYSQLSIAALALSVLLAGGIEIVWASYTIALGCFFFLVAAGMSVAYQSLAIGRLEKISGLEVDDVRAAPEAWYRSAHVPYNVMVSAFMLGAAAIAAAAICKVIGVV